MEAHARSTDPLTSTLAAQSVTGLTNTQERVLEVLERHGDLTRDDLSAHWRTDYPQDHTTDQSIRSRLSELMDTKRVIQVGESTNARGRRVQVVGLPGKQSLF